MNRWQKVILGSLGTTFSGLMGKTKEDFGSGKKYITYMNVFANYAINSSEVGLVTISKFEKQNIVQYGDIIFTTSSETLHEVGMTSVVTSDLGEVYLNSFCFGFRPKDLNIILPEFAVYLFRSREVRKQICFNGQGSTRYNLSKNGLLKNVILSIPTHKEQITIATILSTIDQAIEKTEQLIAKFERIKTGLMQDLLTRGIDEQGNIRTEETHEFKDSVVGRIPKEWEVDSVKVFLNYISYGFTNPMPTTEQGAIMITAANIFKGKIQYDTCRFTSQKDYDSLLTNKSKPLIGDVLITKDGSLGRTAIVDKENICINQSVAVLRVKRNLVDNTFFKTLLESPGYQKKILDDSGGSTIKHIYITKLDKMMIAIPSKLKEQLRILECLNTFNQNVETVLNNLKKLNSLKIALMQDLLTGKVRVDSLIN